MLLPAQLKQKLLRKQVPEKQESRSGLRSVVNKDAVMK